MLNVGDTLSGKRILFVGATGFVGKVACSLLLHRYPDLGTLFCLVRPGAGSTSEERFFDKVVPSPVFDPLRQAHGDDLPRFLRAKCVPLAGDAARVDLNFTPEDLQRLGKLDLIINCAGLVSFTPSLETALRINTLGVRHVRDLAQKTRAGVVHISTCFVAGNRHGDIWEDDLLAGYYPRREGAEPRRVRAGEQGPLRDEDFHVDSEIADCERIIAQVKALADDRAHISMFREKGAARLEEDGRDPDDEKVLKIAVARERKLWVSQRLTELGMERAQHWGWPNIYTYSKSLGDQVLATGTVPYALVRPSIVESALRYPFPGWNEGFTTSAPLIFSMLKGHRTFAAHPKAILDIVPVDLVASVIVSAAAAVIAGTHKHVYQAATGDTSPLPTPRSVELTALGVRRHWKDRETGSRAMNFIRSRLEGVPASKRRFNATSAPAIRAAAESATRLIDAALPRWGAPRLAELAHGLKEKLANVSRIATQTDEAFQLFMPFIHDNHMVFRSDNVRALHASLSEEDRAKLPWDPEKIEWREYWLDLHLPGLKKWVFPNLEEEFRAKPRSVYTYKDLLELFRAAVKLHRSHVAMRLLPPPGSDERIQRYTYRQLGEHASSAATILRDAGKILPGDRVILCAENRPEWGITYFAILTAGGVVVPMDGNSTPAEIDNVARSSGAKLLVTSDRGLERLESKVTTPLLTFGDLSVDLPKGFTPPEHAPKGDDLASLIFTSGTTGSPKGVMLSHRNFTSLLSKLVAVFDVKSHDRLLSVLPLHHTFEFTAGFLMPLMRGAQITYLDEITPEALGAAFEEGDVTAMIGVPALWQLLHRKIRKTVGERGAWAEEVFDAVVDASRKVRDKTGLNIGKLLFWRVQKQLGGRIRLMVSGGSALPPDVMKAFRGMGFSLYEGYGLTEASPVLTVARPGSKVIAGSVGEALPGIEIKIDHPDADGVGEVLASGPNVMMGYYENDGATGEVLSNGWLRTGDLGRLDDEKRLYIVGRKKEMILASNGENVYPDELEELYRDSPLVKELSIVGLPDDQGSETVACLLVPEYGDLPRAEVRARVLEHVKTVSAKLPLYKRVKTIHLWDHDLPRTATRKVKRKLVVEEIRKLSRAVGRVMESTAVAGDWLVELLAQVSQKPRERIAGETPLSELGFDSLMFAELGVALEAAGVEVREDDLTAAGVTTVGELATLVAARKKKVGLTAPATRRKAALAAAAASAAERDEDLPVPAPIVEIGRRVLRLGQRMTYERVFHTQVTGTAYLPKSAPFIVAANHASHLDMGLVKHALGDWGELLVALAAKDYFFDDRLRRAYFENFTNLVPMDRHGSLRESLRLASDVLRDGRILLIFPEGTRSPGGVMQDFKASIGYLALANHVDVVPMYLEGTYDALPKGAIWPAQRRIAAHIGPLLTCAKLRKAAEGMPRSEQYREAARIVEASVRKLGKLGPLITPGGGKPEVRS